MNLDQFSHFEIEQGFMIILILTMLHIRKEIQKREEYKQLRKDLTSLLD